MTPEQKNMELVASGIKCDNPECGWRDDNVQSENYSEWLNVPCPKCGCNLLTQEDFDSLDCLRVAADVINSLSVDQLTELAKSISPDELEQMKQSPLFSQINFDELDNVPFVARIESDGTGELKITEIRKDETGN